MPQDVWPKMWKFQPTHFKPSEFGFSSDLDTRIKEGLHMNQQFVLKLETLRVRIGKPFHINSGWRSIAHNAEVGHAPKSAHCQGRAADISTTGWQPWQRKELVKLARELGCQGFGISSTYIHIDDYTKADGVSRPLMWTYRTGQAGEYGQSVPEAVW